ncbi:MAG: hypothetical protein ACFCUI_13225 [Bernardetiaceae bacterium]
MRPSDEILDQSSLPHAKGLSPWQPAEVSLTALVVLGLGLRYWYGGGISLIGVPFLMLGLFHLVLGWYLHKDPLTQHENRPLSFLMGTATALLAGSFYWPGFAQAMQLLGVGLGLGAMLWAVRRYMVRFYATLLLRMLSFAVLFVLIRFQPRLQTLEKFWQWLVP